MNTQIKTQNPENKMKTLLLSMPKQCSCNICEQTKHLAKDSLGEKKFKQFCINIGLVA